MHKFISNELLPDGTYLAIYEGHFTASDAAATQINADGSTAPATVVIVQDSQVIQSRSGRPKVMKYTKVTVSDLKPGIISVETVFKNSETNAQYVLSWTVPQQPEPIIIAEDENASA